MAGLPLAENITCVRCDPNTMINVTLSVLLTMKLNLIGVIYDDRAASQVSVLVPKLTDLCIKVVMYSANDVIDTNTAVITSYLDTIKGRSTETLSLVISHDIDTTVAIFRSISKFKTLTRPQSGVSQYTKWLVPLPCFGTERVEKEVSDFYNVAVIEPERFYNWSEEVTNDVHIIKTLIIKPFGRRFEQILAANKGQLSPPNRDIFPNVHKGFNGQYFRVGVYVWYPFTNRTKVGKDTTYTGFAVDLLVELSRRLNFTFTMHEPPDNLWGNIRPDGNWTGLVGMLQHHQVDMTVAALIITHERETVMDATFPFYYDNVGVLYKRPDPRESLWKTYFHPFKLEVYMCITGSLVVGFVVYVILALFSPTNERNFPKRGKTLKTAAKSGEEAGFYLTSSLINQGQPKLPEFGSGRTFLAFWWIFAIILAGIYKGNLTAFLLVAKDDLPFSTLGELANQDVYKWGVTGSTVVEHLFNISTRPDFKKIGQGLERFKATDKDTNSIYGDVHLAKVQKGHYAYISDMVPMEIWMTQDCDLRVLKETVIPLPFIVGLQNNSAFVAAFNEQLLDIDQMGLYGVWKDKWWPKGSDCATDGLTNMKVISLLEAQSAFYVLCLGIILGLISLAFEFFRRSYTYEFLKKTIRRICRSRTREIKFNT